MSNNRTPEKIAISILHKNLTKAADILVSLLNSKNEEIRLRAAIAIIEQVLGKPVQRIQLKKEQNST